MSKKSRYLSFMDTLSEETRKGYRTAINEYEKYNGMEMEELITEALDEQENHVPPHKLKIIERIEGFQSHLINKKLCYNTIVLYTGKIKTIYKRNRVSLPYLNSVNPKQSRMRDVIGYKDVLTKEEIKQAVEFMKPNFRARSLTIAQGGLSNEECEHLTLSAFIDDLKQYHKSDDLMTALKWLANENNPVIWVTKLIRQKTKKPYYAIIGPEAVNAIATSKINEIKSHKYKPTDKLIMGSKRYFMEVCLMVNNSCGFGKVAEEAKFRSHNLRRFHATHIRGSVLSYDEKYHINNAEIDELQGRGKTAVQDTYIKTNPLEQKLIYAKVMNNLALYHEYEYEIINDDVVISIKNAAAENQKLRDEVKILSAKLESKKRNSEKLNALREELGDDAFKELVYGILNAS